MGTLNLLTALSSTKCRKLIFSSSSTIYGAPKSLPLTENTDVGLDLTSPYGKTKYFCEEILRDFTKAEKDWRVVMLRYMNPIGAHPSGDIGEDPFRCSKLRFTLHISSRRWAST
eukprot:UN24026